MLPARRRLIPGHDGSPIAIMNTAFIDRCLDTIQSEMGAPPAYQQSFDELDRFVEAVGDRDVAELLAGFVGPSRPRQVICEMLGILVWSTPDNGSAIFRTYDRWLRECSDEKKCWLALNGQVLVLSSATEAGQVLSKVIERYPSLTDSCRSQIDQWSRIACERIKGDVRPQ